MLLVYRNRHQLAGGVQPERFSSSGLLSVTVTPLEKAL
jgi:hypothetical protein